MTQFNSNDEHRKKGHWRSFEDLENSSSFLKNTSSEFPQDATYLDLQPGLDRRKFLGIVGASLALAGAATTAGCIRRPEAHIYPESVRPEDTLPGVSKSYATSAQIAGSVLSLSVTSTDGRPTKIDGNNRHHTSNSVARGHKGGSHVFAQAEILNMYDPDRGTKCLYLEQELPQKDAYNFLQKSLFISRKTNGSDLALLVCSYQSPSLVSLIDEFKLNYPKALIVEQDSTYSKNRKEGLSAAAETPVDIFYHFENAKVILAVDSDFMGLEGDSVKHAFQFAEGRRAAHAESSMNRLYSVESALSITGAAADHHYVLRSQSMGDFLILLASKLSHFGVSFPPEVSALLHKEIDFPQPLKNWVTACAKDLFLQSKKSVVVIGDRLPPWMHLLGLSINQGLSALGNSVTLLPDTLFIKNQSSYADLQSAFSDGVIKTLIVVGGNPVYTSCADFNFSEEFKKVKNSFYLGLSFNETAQVCQYYFPQTHFLESWGDSRASDGTVSIRQPLIAPLFPECTDEYSFLYFLSYGSLIENSYLFVKKYWQKKLFYVSSFENSWKSYLSNGVICDYNKEKFSSQKYSFHLFSKFYSTFEKTPEPTENFLDIEFFLDRKVYDGLYSNNAWLQELPDPIHKLVWDNALLINSKTAKTLNLHARPQPGTSWVDVVKITYQGRSMKVPVWETPGVADFTGVLQLGYGRKFGRVAQGCGFNGNVIRISSHYWFGSGLKLEKTGERYSLVSTQEHGSLSGTPNLKEDRPPVIREATLAEFKAKPNFVLDFELLPLEKQKSHLFSFPRDPSQEKWARQQWGMAIDLNTCIGCNACTIACQAENNISVVGKEEVFKNREMGWIRVDRYFTGAKDDPQVRTLFQPVNCQHCENAPCEAVCPVAATVHSPDGLNDMAYNRCVGTRYCANNCPYKVRRYNFFNYSKNDDERNPLYAMQKNPHVTVRFRGVMEKCTYCVQKINHARSKYKKISDGIVPDGEIVTACQKACPTQAIVFGDVADPSTAVSQMKAQSRNYSVLGELNTKPRTTYLAKLRNINPEIS
jgi:MoCo/4Fe-4S cofactor protein with predicted Tat translocation signal